MNKLYSLVLTFGVIISFILFLLAMPLSLILLGFLLLWFVIHDFLYNPMNDGW